MAVDLGPRLGLLINADIGEAYYDQFRPFLRAIDALLLGAVINTTTTAPPSSPSNGDAYILKGTPSGAWTGQHNAIAVWSTEITQSGNNTKVPGWEFFLPNAGWTVWDTATSTLQVFSTGTWVNILANVALLNVDNNWTATQTFEDGWTSASDVSISTASAATSSDNQNSPVLGLTGAYWNGTASAPDTWSVQVQPGTGTDPTSTLFFSHTGSTGTAIVQYATDVFALDFNGNNGDFNGNVSCGSLFASNQAFLYSSNTATGSNNQNAAPLIFQSNYWNGSASVPDDWQFAVNLGTGANPTSTLILTHTNASGSGFEFQVPNISVQGNIQGASLVVQGGTQFDAGFSSLGTSVLTAVSATSTSGNMAAPEFRHANQYWDGSASQSDNWNWTCTIGTGTSPTTQLTLLHNGSPGDAEFHVPNLNLDSAVTATTATAGSETLPSNPLGFWETTINGTTVKIPYYAV